MNTKPNFSKRNVLTILALLVAFLLPSALMAQDYSVNQADDRRVGFGESDPALGQLQHSKAFWQVPDNQVTQARVGFSEIDPAAELFQDESSFLFASSAPITNEIIGFGESTVVAKISDPVKEPITILCDL